FFDFSSKKKRVRKAGNSSKKNVSKIGIILLIFNSILLTSCNIFDSPDTKHEASIEFEHQWNGEKIELNKYYKFQYQKQI
ncbi:hypothetical protein, partial [Tenacibaculum piscium]|uniref:hypothetical protein n=1 Tax=Tenacibaculum piscium TaxID=1458515 RepID=UPI001F29EE0B